MWELNCEESWVLKNWCFWTLELKKTLESPLDCKEIQAVHPKGYQSWIFIGRIDAEAETPILWPPNVKSWLIGRLWCWEGLGAGGEGDDRGWDGWMASSTRWTWVWVNSVSWWWTGRSVVLWFMGSQRVRHDWATELMIIGNNRNINWTLYLPWKIKLFKGKLNNNQQEDYQRTDLRRVNHTKCPKQAESLRNTNFSPKIILNVLKS